MRKQKWVTTLVLALLCLNLVSFPLTLFDDLPSIGIAGEQGKADLGWLSGYGYRKQFNVTGSISGAQTNYTITVTVHYGNGIDSGQDIYLNGKVSKNFQDIRFTKDDGLALLECNREEWYHGDKATFSIMIPSLPASPNITMLYIYYDNPKTSWRKYDNNPVFQNDPEKDWENVSVRDTSIVWNGSHYYMFYEGVMHTLHTGYPTSEHDPLETAIGLAISTDGVNWTRMNNGEPVLSKNISNPWEANAVGIPDVMYKDGVFHMWYAGDSADSGWYYVLGYANSTNGINWTRSPNNPILVGSYGKFDQKSIFSHGVVYNGTHYVMAYTGWSPSRHEESGVAISPTPWGNFTKLNNGDPVATFDEAWERDEVNFKDLVLVNGTYYAIYSGGHGSKQMQVGIAKSTNLIDWTKDVNPVLENWAGTFDAQQLQDPNFLQMNDTGKWRIYYSGASEGGDFGNFDIGFAETDETLHPLFLSDTSGCPVRNGDNSHQIYADFNDKRGDAGTDEGFDAQAGSWEVKWEDHSVPFGEANFFYEGYGWGRRATSLYDSANSNQNSFVIEVRAKLADPDITLANYDILFRWQDLDNYYGIQFVYGFQETDGRLALTKVVGGNNTEIASYSLARDRNWHAIKIIVNDTNCKVFFDGKQRIPSSGWKSIGSDFSNGKIGFQVEYARAQFDDLKVYKYIAPEPSITGRGTEEIVSEYTLFAVICSTILVIVLVLWILKKKRNIGSKASSYKKAHYEDGSI